MIRIEECWRIEKNALNDEGEENHLIKWEHNEAIDLFNLSEAFFLCAYETTLDITIDDDNEKYDNWFLPCMYMFRQSIELMLKSLIAKVYVRKELQDIFVSHKHNLEQLLETYGKNIEVWNIDSDERCWIQRYLHNLEIVDKKSDLFRYPFRDDFLNQYSNHYLDIADIGNDFQNAYAILKKEYKGQAEKNIIDIDTSMNPEFLILANHGIGNCQLWRSPWTDEFHKQVEGYSKVALFLYEKYEKDNDKRRTIPILFLLRNAIELACKRLLHAEVDKGVSKKIKRKLRSTHSLKKLWKGIRDMLRFYAIKNGEDINDLIILEEEIFELDLLDKEGDAFRFPFSFSLEYRLEKDNIDFDRFFDYMAGIFNILDGCHWVVEECAQYEK